MKGNRPATTASAARQTLISQVQRFTVHHRRGKRNKTVLRLQESPRLKTAGRDGRDIAGFYDVYF